MAEKSSLGLKKKRIQPSDRHRSTLKRYQFHYLRSNSFWPMASSFQILKFLSSVKNISAPNNKMRLRISNLCQFLKKSSTMWLFLTCAIELFQLKKKTNLAKQKFISFSLLYEWQNWFGYTVHMYSVYQLHAFMCCVHLALAS